MYFNWQKQLDFLAKTDILNIYLYSIYYLFLTKKSNCFLQLIYCLLAYTKLDKPWHSCQQLYTMGAVQVTFIRQRRVH